MPSKTNNALDGNYWKPVEPLQKREASKLVILHNAYVVPKQEETQNTVEPIETKFSRKAQVVSRFFQRTKRKEKRILVSGTLDGDYWKMTTQTKRRLRASSKEPENSKIEPVLVHNDSTVTPKKEEQAGNPRPSHSPNKRQIKEETVPSLDGDYWKPVDPLQKRGIKPVKEFAFDEPSSTKWNTKSGRSFLKFLGKKRKDLEKENGNDNESNKRKRRKVEHAAGSKDNEEAGQSAEPTRYRQPTLLEALVRRKNIAFLFLQHITVAKFKPRRKRNSKPKVKLTEEQKQKMYGRLDNNCFCETKAIALVSQNSFWLLC